MTDELGGTSTARVPAWKLRQQQGQNRPSPPLAANDELGGGRSSASRRRNNDELGSIRSSDMNSRPPSRNDDLGGTRSPNTSPRGRVPAWKLRENLKREKNDLDDTNSVGTSSTESSRTVSRVPDAVDPTLPSAFRAAYSKQQERKKKKDDFLSLSSVHSRTTYSCESDSYGSLNSDSDSFDGEDSFASMDSDADEDDEAYRESRNQLARLEIEKQNQSHDAKRAGTTSRFKKKSVGVHGTPLGFIAE